MLMSATSVLGFVGGTVDVRPVDNPSSLFDSWVQLPPKSARSAPRAQALVVGIRRMTGWSLRQLAGVLSSTHPTIAAVEQGRSAARIRDLFARLNEVHNVVERAHLLAERDVTETDRILTTASSNGVSAIEFLDRRDPAAAYLLVLDVLRPPRAEGMMNGLWPSRAGEATSDLSADSERG